MICALPRARRALLVLLAAIGLTAVAVAPAQAAKCLNGKKFVLQSRANGDYVSARIDRGGAFTSALQAVAPQHGTWEVFMMRCFPKFENGDIVSEEFAFMSVRNSLWVAAELDYAPGTYGLLRARSAAADGIWERFKFAYYDERPEWGNRNIVVGLTSTRNNKWLSVQTDITGQNYGMVRAVAPSMAGNREQFNLTWLP
jgi:hypothetical protein